MAIKDSRTRRVAPSSTPAPVPRPGTASKQIRRLRDAGYTFKLATDFLWKNSGAWLISVPDAAPEDFIVRLVIDIDQGMITIIEAWNKYRDPIKTLKLRDMIMSVWKFEANQDAASLEWVQYKGVVETYTVTTLPEIYERLSDGSKQDIYIPETSACRKMRQAYCQLMLHPVLTIGARKMVREYPELSGRIIDGFVVSRAGRVELPDFSIHLGDCTPRNKAQKESSGGLTVTKKATNTRKTKVRAR